MTKLMQTDLSPDGARIVINWGKFTPGSSVFIPAINTRKAVEDVLEATGLAKKDLVIRVRVENGLYGVRVWRVR